MQACCRADDVQRAGAQFFRWWAYQPRTSPYSVSGIGREGLRLIAMIASSRVKIITESLYESLDLGRSIGRIHWARNMQIFRGFC